VFEVAKKSEKIEVKFVIEYKCGTCEAVFGDKRIVTFNTGPSVAVTMGLDFAVHADEMGGAKIAVSLRDASTLRKVPPIATRVLNAKLFVSHGCDETYTGMMFLAGVCHVDDFDDSGYTEVSEIVVSSDD
jgi:hypothetical protein